MAYKSGLSPGQTHVELTIPPVPVLNAPAQDSVLADDTIFSWSNTAGAYIWILISDAYYEGIFVVTSEHQLSLPSFPNGLDLLRPGNVYLWRVETHGDAESVDDLTGPKGFAGEYHYLSPDEPEGPVRTTSTYALSSSGLVQTPQ